LTEPAAYSICSRCIIDSTVPGAQFLEDGYCSGCTSYFRQATHHRRPLEVRQKDLVRLVARIQAEGAGKPFDCIVGVSGGVDSTFVALQAKRLGLRPLAVHLDNGWNSNLAVSNIEKCCRSLGIELYTHVLDWSEFRDLQLAFLHASTPDSEIPTDHAILAVLSQKAHDLGLRTILSGVNASTEGITFPGSSGNQYDWKYIRSIHRLFGTRPLATYPHLSLVGFFWARQVLRQRQVNLLDYFDYHKEEATRELQRELGWQPYAGKHHESVYTRFFQTCYLPIKFGYDKRRLHLANLVVSGQLSREEAMAKMEAPIASEEQRTSDIQYVAKKLGISSEELMGILTRPGRSWTEFPSSERGLFMRAWRRWKQL